MSFREWLNERSQIDAVGKVYNATNSAKNAAWYKGTLYIEFKKLKTALNLQKKVADELIDQGATTISASEVKSYDKMTKAILNNKNAVAVFEIKFDKMPKDAMKAYKIKEISANEIKANGKAMGF
jgi:hypothetical protein